MTIARGVVRGVAKPVRALFRLVGGANVCAACGAHVAIWLPHPLVLQQPPLLTHLRAI